MTQGVLGDSQVTARALLRKIRQANDPNERATLALELLPKLVNAEERNLVLEVIELVGELQDERLNAHMYAFRVLGAAMNGDAVQRVVSRCLTLLESTGPQDQTIILQRLGLAYHIMGDIVPAERFGVQSLQIAESIGDRERIAYTATLLGSLAYVQEDYDRGIYYAQLACIEGRAAGNDLLYHWGLVMQYDFYEELGRWDDKRMFRDTLTGITLDPTLGIRFVRDIGDVSLLIYDGMFKVALARLESMPQQHDIANRALVRAMYSLSAAALNDDLSARAAARDAFSLPFARAAQASPSVNQRIQTSRANHASVIGAFVMTLVGERHEGRRALEARVGLPGAEGEFAKALLSYVATSSWGDAAERVGRCRGTLDMLTVVLAARSKVRMLRAGPGGHLTDDELRALRIVAENRSNEDVALELKVSYRTVERMMGRIFKKLGVRNRHEAVDWLRNNTAGVL